ncbi:MAG: hypothetical protein NTZ60_10775 [Campylobacterales bacterium]|nr:hypothetical protein [Campylobacterales bacterium]
MRLLLVITMLFSLSGCGTKMEVKSENHDYNVSFNEVWNQVASDELEDLPQKEVSFFKLSSSKEDTLLKDARRTLDNHSDILEPFEKLAHPNGICFKGIWDIDTENIYSGYFKKSSQALIITRASSVMSNTKSGDTRAFGFAGKLFPTTNPNSKNSEQSANFFLIDDLGGTNSKHYTDVQLTNEPPLSITFEVVKNLLYALKVSHTFAKADENQNIRQLYEISELGESDNKNIITPKWMKIEAKNGTKVDAKDFRDELKIHDGEELIFTIFVANTMLKTEKEWQKIGTITLDISMVSESCDHRLHFHHPKWRSDLDYGTTLSPKPF